MIRFLLFALAVVCGGIGYVFQTPWLFYVAAGLAVLGVVFAVAHVREEQKRARAARQMRPKPPSKDDELKSLGITEVRPVVKKKASEVEAVVTPATPKGGHTPSATPKPVAKKAADKSAVVPRKMSPSARNTALSELEAKLSGAFLKPYLQSARSAIDAHTVALISRGPQETTFRVDAIVSASRNVRHHTSIPSKSSFLKRVDLYDTVTALRDGEGGFEAKDLEYYSEHTPVVEVAVAPVPALTPRMAYLLADTKKQFSPRDYNLLHKYAHLLHDVFADESEPSLMHPTTPITASPSEERPRREIVEEEMNGARAEGGPLGLALVYQNDAEAVAERGEGAVEQAERALHAALAQSAPAALVVRFGELTYGVFHRAPTEAVEQWAARVQTDADLSVGVAMLADRHQDADAFRADATAALSEAFRSEQCVLVE